MQAIEHVGRRRAASSIVWVALLAGCAVEAPRPAPASLGGADSDWLGAAAPVSRAREGGSLAPVAGDRRLGVGVGATYGPDTFALTGEADFYLTDRVAVGPSLLLAFADDAAILAPTCHGKVVFPIERSGGQAQFLPFVEGGAGLVYLQKDRVGKDNEIGLLLQAGGGVEVRFDEHFALTSTVLANVMPIEVLDERAFLSWQIVGLTFRF